MNYREWKKKRKALKEEYQRHSDETSRVHKEEMAHDALLMLQFTLPSGTRTTITGIDEDRHVITAADDRGFLTLGMLSIADLEVFLEIRKTIEAWKRGDIEELPRPAREFGPWRTP